MSDRVAEAISDINLAWRNRRPGAEIISEQQCRHIAQELRAMGLVTEEGDDDD